MNNPEPLIAAYLDGVLTDTERAELNAWLKADAANLRRFTEAVMFEQQIRTALTRPPSSTPRRISIQPSST